MYYQTLNTLLSSVHILLLSARSSDSEQQMAQRALYVGTCLGG